MSSAPTSRESLGLIGNSAVGYQLAVLHGRRLLAVLLPVLSTALLSLYLLDLLRERDRMVILDGYPAVSGTGSGGTGWAKIAVVAACWLVGLAAGTATVADAEQNRTTRPLRTLTAAVVGARLLIRLIATRGRVPSTAGAFVLGGIVLPLGAAFVLGDAWAALPDAFGVPLAALLLTFVVAAQAGILAHVGLPTPTEVAEAAGSSADAEAEVPGAVRRPWAAVAVAVVALVAPIGFAALNPFGVSRVESFGNAPGPVAAVAWPAGGNPVIATISGARFCDSDLCDRYVDQDGGPGVYDGYGTAAISADGTAVVKAALTGGSDTGGPFIHYSLCTRAGCPAQWFPVRASAREPAGWADLAAAVAPDHSFWFGLATVPENDESRYELAFIRCPDSECSKPERHRAGTVARDPEDVFAGRRRAALAIGADGRPTLVVRTGTVAHVVTCDPVGCANPRTTSTFAGAGTTAWSTDAGEPGRVIGFEPGRLQVGEQIVPLESAEIAAWSGAVAAAGSHVYATAAERADPPGLHVTVTTADEPAEPAYWRQVLWRCDTGGCSRQALDGLTQTWGREGLAVAGDGRVLIVGESRILLVTPR
ncbi:MAG TPA: hypothetical protein VN408_29245 [Actinoplanes sp.]|nr:hypothetical protein [Actinoplanes sp.]